MTIMLKNYVETLCVERGGDKREHCISLSPTMYDTLARRRSDIAAASPAHIVWDNESNSLLFLGSEEAVRQTGLLLSQYAASAAGGQARKLVGRTFTHKPETGLNIADAKNLLLTSQLPPELTISSPGLSTNGGVGSGGGYSQFSGLGHSPVCRVVSDGGQRERAASFNRSRRKLESEDSSYDSDHDHPLYQSLSRSHDDVSRTTSELLHRSLPSMSQ
jgi:hypothetical protein